MFLFFFTTVCFRSAEFSIMDNRSIISWRISAWVKEWRITTWISINIRLGLESVCCHKEVRKWNQLIVLKIVKKINKVFEKTRLKNSYSFIYGIGWLWPGFLNHGEAYRYRDILAGTWISFSLAQSHSGSQHQVVDDQQNRMKHNLVTYIV